LGAVPQPSFVFAAPKPERQQLKWLLYSLVIFTVIYAATVVFVGSDTVTPLFDVLFFVSIILIPVVMTMSVLRYRLFDIDLIIRKTLVYGLLTGLLTAVYFGSWWRCRVCFVAKATLL
jgi:hypothetical protein